MFSLGPESCKQLHLSTLCSVEFITFNPILSTIVFENPGALGDTFVHKYTQQNLQCSFTDYGVESPLSPCFHVNSATCFGHTGPSPGICDDLHKLLYHTVVSHNP
jgi:hypothetical protein